ncbi:MAG: SDR family NAD(P)-dependent oxidoreductase [Pleomorphochaeta sp.]
MKALVIGGTSNIGISIIDQLYNENYEIEFTFSNNLSKANEIKNKYNLKSYQIDITQENQVKELFDNVCNIDLLVIVSGIFTVASQQELSLDDFNKVIDINIKGTFLIVKHSIISMNLNSSIVMISSTNAYHPGFGNTAHYDGSKGFVLSYTKSLASELGPNKIRVNAVAPGLIEAPYLHDKDNPVLNMFLDRAIIKDTVKAEDVALTVSFLAKNKAIDGQCIVVDCGYLIG